MKSVGTTRRPPPVSSNRFDVLPVDEINDVFDETEVPKPVKRSLTIGVRLKSLDTLRSDKAQALVDSGATGCFIDEEFVKKNKWPMEKLAKPIPVRNADMTKNSAGDIRYTVDLEMEFKDHKEVVQFQVVKLGKTPVFLGYPWLKKHNPRIDWEKDEIEFRTKTKAIPIPRPKNNPKIKPETRSRPWTNPRAFPEIVEDGEEIWLVQSDIEEEFSEAINLKENVSTRIAIEQNARKEKLSFEQIVPEAYRDFKDVFEKDKFDELPEKRKWDHAIEMKPGWEPKMCKLYPLSLDEQEKLDEFLKENLESRRIRVSKSPQASPFFFVKKKDGKLRPVQDYRKLNEFTVRNQTQLPLMSEVVHKLRGAKYFTALDVRWGLSGIA